MCFAIDPIKRHLDFPATRPFKLTAAKFTVNYDNIFVTAL
jgi:hypothetical protein